MGSASQFNRLDRDGDYMEGNLQLVDSTSILEFLDSIGGSQAAAIRVNGNDLEFYDTTLGSWVKLSDLITNVGLYERFTATASQSTFTLTTGSYTVGNNSLNVYLNGVRVPNSYVTEDSPTQFTIASPYGPCNAGDTVEAIVPPGRNASESYTAKVTTSDTTGSFLNNKLVAGTEISLTVLNSGGNEQLQIDFTGVSDDKKTLVSSGDTTADYLESKITAGTDISVTKQNAGGNETLEVAFTGVSDDKTVLVSSGDTTNDYLENKLVAGSGVTIAKQNAGGNENLSIASVANQLDPTVTDAVITASTTLTSAQHFVRINPFGPVSDIRVYLPPTPDTGKEYIFKIVTASTWTINVIIDGNGKNIDKGTTYTGLTSPLQAVTMVYDGTEWWTV